MAEPVIYRQHNCTRQHRTFAAMAKCLWPRAVWIDGEGPYATVAYCNGSTSVQLHKALEGAETSLAQIDRTGCGGRCGGRHKLVRLDLPGAAAVVRAAYPAPREQSDLTAADLRKLGL